MEQLLNEINRSRKLMGLTLLSEASVRSGERIKIIDKPELLVVIPLSTTASCKYGAFTQYCISAPENDSFLSDKRIFVFFLTFETSPDGKRGDRTSYQVLTYDLLSDKFTWFNMKNKERNNSEVEYPEGVIEDVKNFVKNNKVDIFKKKHVNDPIAKVYLDEEPDPSLTYIHQITYSELIMLEKYNRVLSFVKEINYVEFTNSIILDDEEKLLPTEDIHFDKIFPNLENIRWIYIYEYSVKNIKIEDEKLWYRIKSHINLYDCEDLEHFEDDSNDVIQDNRNNN